jgi:signal transduction histidine kinase
MPSSISLLSPSATCASALAVAEEMRAVLGPAGELARTLAAETPSYRPEFGRLAELSESLGFANAILSQVFPHDREPHETQGAFSVDAMARAILPMLRASVRGRAKVTLTEDSHSPLLHGNPLALKRALLHIVRSLAATITDPHGVIDVGVTLIDFSDNYPAAQVSRSPSPRRMVRLTVADNGIGMDPARIQSVLQCGSDGAPPLRWEDAGLQIACCIVKDHGGLLDIESHAGLGTMIRIDLPVVWLGRVSPVAANADSIGGRRSAGLLP